MSFFQYIKALLLNKKSPPPTVVVWINNSSITDAQAQVIVGALNLQAPVLARSWSQPRVLHVFGTVDTPGTIKAYFLPDPDQAGDLGYHTVDPQGNPYIRVFVDPILANGGTVLTGALSVSVCASHEACEIAVDPSCELTATAANGDVWCKEVADPVENTAYHAVFAHQKVWLSDFVLPAFFIPGEHSLKVDYLGALQAPFTLAPGGYAVINNEAKFAPMADGTPYPEWKKATKLAPPSRTYTRLHPAA